ncbi:hypothetical protein NDU88_009720 [Pleurodeles waltl]|uniref:Uncharacterized protein n=1 Tax=Pleurodeles waltl TaxID=8319 RepID=A0AAV7PZT9_PLEWA|nr:hypothetical protein NDU88_009720 [Pleurodeles waltl]
MSVLVNLIKKWIATAKTVAGATSSDGTGKGPGGTYRRRDPVTSEDFQGQEDAEEPKRKWKNSMRYREETGDAERLQQEKSGNPSKEDDAEEQGDEERQEEKGNAREEDDTEKQEGRGDTRKEEDWERRCDGEKQRARSGAGEEEPDTRKPLHVPRGTWLHKVRSVFLIGSPIGVKGEGERVRG